MQFMLLLVSVATVASSPPTTQACENGGTRIGSVTLESPQACRVNKDRRTKACSTRGCDRD